MTAIQLTGCLGLDTRPSWSGSDSFVLDAATSVQVDPGGSLSTRPAVVYVADLSALSVGLYARGGYLRCIVPSGLSLQGTAPAGVIYDGIGRGGTYDYSSKISEVTASDSFDISAVSGPHGYVALLRADTSIVEHHWIKDPPASAASFTDTYVSLPFQPGRSMIRIANKIVATSPKEGYFRYCSTTNGPSDWTTVGDAGFEAALQFVSGARDFIALGIHRGQLAVFYSDAVQLWHMEEDPAAIELLQVLNGPGTDFSGSVANVLGDAIFLSRSGFANLATATITGEARFAAIGERIRSLTDAISSTATAVSLWSQKRSQYLCAVGTTVYCYSVYAQGQGMSDFWTSWTMPATVTAMAENAGSVYIRSGNALYRLDDTSGTDYTGTDIAWSFALRPLGFGRASAFNKELQHLTVQCTGASTWTPVVDGRTLTANAVRFPASTSPLRTMFNGHGRRVGASVSGSGHMRLDGLVIEAGAAGE